MGNVPESELQRAFDWAFKNHDSNFPITAYDIKDAYFSMLNAEKETRRKEHERFMRENEERNRRNEHFECPECFNSGFRMVPHPKGIEAQVAIRCDRCRYWQFHAERMAA